MALTDQVHIYSVDTSAFYTDEESNLSRKIYETKGELSELEKKLASDKDELLTEAEIEDLKSSIKKLQEFIRSSKDSLRKLIASFTGQRVLRPEHLQIKKSISIFDSTLTRTLGLHKDRSIVHDSLLVVRVYFFDVFKSLVENGFLYNGEKYVFFTASAGQIRTKKNVFIKESALIEHHDSLYCGLSVERINEMGGVNPNKYLAYLALCNSATDCWNEFDIDKSIVVDDVETLVKGVVDNINQETWEIERCSKEIPITHTDGCGMILPKLSKNNFMIRMPWVKGLLISFPYDEFIDKHHGEFPTCSKIVDIYGREHDVLKEDIQIIFTKSQFKMWKYYNSWDEYKDYFKRFSCEAGRCNEENRDVEDAKISYQMLQTLCDLSDEELTHIARRTNYTIKTISSDRRTMLRCFGVKKSNLHKTYLQKSLEIYPEMISDVYTRTVLAQIKKKIVNEGRGGRLRINGKYTFVSPDWYAMCEAMFLKRDNPVGLLDDGEVYCSLYPSGDKLDCLRSPHLYIEHAVRVNTFKDNEDARTWFTTTAVYSSSHDLISKILQFDNDGDQLIVCADDVIIQAAERNTKDVVPLFYEMKKSEPRQLNGESLYSGMIAAYTGGNIGEVSNSISKIWNSDVPDVYLVKLLTAYNNFVIDYAKTLYKPVFPDSIKYRINSFTRRRLPHFFKYAKPKTTKHTEKINTSPVNRLEQVVVNKRFDFDESRVGAFNYKNLMGDQKLKYDSDNPTHTAVIAKYKELVKRNKFLFNDMDGEFSNYSKIYSEIRNELAAIGDVQLVVDILVNYLYGEVNAAHKESLWGAFGDVIYDNIKSNLSSDTFSCDKCGKRVQKPDGAQYNAQKYCDDCTGYIPIETKSITCIDCGKEVMVDARNMTKTKCDKCYNIYRKKYKSQKELERYYKNKS